MPKAKMKNVLFVAKPFVFSFYASIVYIISAPASPLLGFMVDKTGKNITWVLCAVVITLLAHMMLAFTFWNPWFAMVKPLYYLCNCLIHSVIIMVDLRVREMPSVRICGITPRMGCRSTIGLISTCIPIALIISTV